MRILVTGSAGFIGSNFVMEWLSENQGPVISFDKLTYAGNKINLASCLSDSRHTFINGDICETEKLAKIFTKNPAAYEYLADSIMNFPTRKEFVTLMQSVGLKNCKGIPLTFGVCTLYIGQK